MKVLLIAAACLMMPCILTAVEQNDAVTGATVRYKAEKTDLKKIVTGKKILVVYFSLTGTTERVAKDIADCFGADIEKIVDKKNRKGFFGFISGGKDATFRNLTEIDPIKLDPSKYDITMVGTPIWSWAMTPAIRTYITRNKDKFKEVAFFVTAGSTPAENIVPSMEKIAGKKSVAYVGFVSKDLKDNSKYWAKLTKFLGAFKQK
ncbi:MAG: flavodoxin [Elusimicrobiota bacterium]